MSSKGSNQEPHTSQFERRQGDVKGRVSENAPILMDLPELERDRVGIPLFVFNDHLKTEDKPSAEHKVLEVVLMWREAVMSVGHYKKDKTRITIGDALKNDFRVASDELPIERFSLVEARGDNFYVNWTDRMGFETRNDQGDTVLGTDELQQQQKINRVESSDCPYSQYQIGLDDRVAIQIGEVTFVLQYVSPAQVVKTGVLKGLDYYFTKILTLSFIAHLFFVLALRLTPLAPEQLDDDLFSNPNRFAKLILKEPPKAPKKKKRFELSGSKGGGRHKDKEGKFGKPKKDKRDALASTKGAPVVDPKKKERDRKIALESGIFKALNGGKGGAVSNVFGPGGLGTGINNALGGLRGSAMGDAGGAGGLGTRGTGPGGGGNSLGIGGLGDGTGRGTGGLGDIDLGGRGKGRYKVVPGRTITKGCLSQQVVLRVISRAQNQARYCYERELQRNPNLFGKVTTQFVIGAKGRVRSARVTGSTLGSPAVERCLTRIMQRLKFPPCSGGGTARVTYPWIFKSGGK